MPVFLAFSTYFAYLFITLCYLIKIVTYLRLPVHLRWELYPVIYEKNLQYGKSRFEGIDGLSERPKKHLVRAVFFLVKEYLHFGEYFRRHRLYWSVLYPWHIGFLLIILFHSLCFVGGLAMAWNIGVSATSSVMTGRFLFYAILATGAVGFVAGSLGSIGLLALRIYDPSLRAYATPLNYVSYLFTLALFLSGLCGWLFFDTDLAEYRGFWKGLVTFTFVPVGGLTLVHIVTFNLFLVYLPFTRSLHYITRFFAFFLIRWDDEPNVRGGRLEARLKDQLRQNVSWAAPHVRSGKSWQEQAADDEN